MRRVAAAIALFAGILVPSIAAAGRFEGTNLSFEKVLEKAKASKRLALLDFVRPGCAWCTALERETFADARVAKALDDFVLARYDAESEGGRGPAQRYRVRAFPTMVVVDGVGAEVDRLVGFSPPEKFLAEAERIRSGEGTLPALAAAHEKAPDDTGAAVAYARKLGRGDLDAATALLDRVASRTGARAEDRLAVHAARADLALDYGDTEGALAAFAKVLEESPKSAAADDARVARVRLLASEGRLAKALEEAEAARGVMTDPAKRAAIEEATFHLQRAGLERTLVRWGEGAAEAKDGAALHAAARAALESGAALGSALRWVERAADLTNRAPETLDTWARIHAALLAFESAVARGRDALAAGLSGPAREALEASIARWEAALRAPDVPVSDPAGAAGPSGRATPPAAGEAHADAPAPGSPAPRTAPGDPCPPATPPADPCPPTPAPSGRPAPDASR